MALVPFPGPQSAARPLPPEEDEESSVGKMTFLEHLDELRKRIILACYGIAAGVLIGFFFIDRIFNFIMAPTVHLDTDFPNPSRFGDRLTFKLQVAKIGRSSVNLEIEGSCQGQPRVTFKQTLVFMSATDRTAVAIPPDIVHRLKRYLVEAPRKAKTPAG